MTCINAMLRRSVAFFQKHATGTLLSTIVNDIERVQFAMSSVLAEMMQQFFTFFFTAASSSLMGGKLAWVLLIFVPVVIGSAVAVGRSVRHTTRQGQDRLAEIQNILHETITGVRIVKAFGMELWEMMRFRRRRAGCSAPISLGERRGDQFAADGYLGCDRGRACCSWSDATDQDRLHDRRQFMTFIVAVFRLYDPVRKFARLLQQLPAGNRRILGRSSTFMHERTTVREKPGARAAVRPFARQHPIRSRELRL